MAFVGRADHGDIVAGGVVAGVFANLFPEEAEGLPVVVLLIVFQGVDVLGGLGVKPDGSAQEGDSAKNDAQKSGTVHIFF